MSSLYGPMFLPSTLTTAAEELLKEFFPMYLAEMELREGYLPGTLKVPKNYGQRNQYTGNPGEELPKVVVITPGIIGTPAKTGGNAFRATWRLGIGTLIAAETEEESFHLAGIYGTCVMAIVEHHQSIKGVSTDTNLLDYSLDDIPIEGQLQKFRAANLFFACEIDNMVVKYIGPKYDPVPTGIVEKVVTTIGPQGV